MLKGKIQYLTFHTLDKQRQKNKPILNINEVFDCLGFNIKYLPTRLNLEPIK
jgi:hypothetical protein